MERKEQLKGSKPTPAAAQNTQNPYYRKRTPAQSATSDVVTDGSTDATINCRWSYGTVFEKTLSFCAVRRVGDVVYSCGTMAVDEEANAVESKDDADLQTRYILSKLDHALKQVGSCLADVVNVQLYTTKVSDTIMIGYEFAQAFKDIMPAMTLLPVPELVRDDCSVMIQVTAIVQPINHQDDEE